MYIVYTELLSEHEKITTKGGNIKLGFYCKVHIFCVTLKVSNDIPAPKHHTSVLDEREQPASLQPVYFRDKSLINPMNLWVGGGEQAAGKVLIKRSNV
jgi:hypothetical protein